MNQNRKTVSVRILDKDYQVICEPNAESMLEASARHLDSSMRSIRNTGKVVGSDRIAVIAALNVTNEMLHGNTTEDAAFSQHPIDDELQRLSQKLDKALLRYAPSESES